MNHASSEESIEGSQSERVLSDGQVGNPGNREAGGGWLSGFIAGSKGIEAPSKVQKGDAEVRKDPSSKREATVNLLPDMPSPMRKLSEKENRDCRVIGWFIP